MSSRTRALRAVRIKAFAKINLTLRVLGTRPDGYHDLRTTFQTLALHDTLTFITAPGPFRIHCSDDRCPADETNLVWRAAQRLWQTSGRDGAVRDVVVRIDKRIPLEGGLGGGSSDAAATLLALVALWRLPLGGADVDAIARDLGADVPFFLAGGTALGLERGDLLFPLEDLPVQPVVLVCPPFGVSTRDAFAWADTFGRLRSASDGSIPGLSIPLQEMGNDLEAPVSAHHPDIDLLTTALRDMGAEYAAMSGSGSTVFGLFSSRRRAMAAARACARRPGGPFRTLVTETLNRGRYRRNAQPVLAASRPGRIDLPFAPRSQAHS